MAQGLSCSGAREIFPDQGLNPCLLHSQADSLPLRHQVSPGGVLQTTQAQLLKPLKPATTLKLNKGEIKFILTSSSNWGHSEVSVNKLMDFQCTFL